MYLATTVQCEDSSQLPDFWYCYMNGQNCWSEPQSSGRLTPGTLVLAQLEEDNPWWPGQCCRAGAPGGRTFLAGAATLGWLLLMNGKNF